MFAFKTVLLFIFRLLWRHGLCCNTTSIKHWKLNFLQKNSHKHSALNPNRRAMNWTFKKKLSVFGFSAQ